MTSISKIKTLKESMHKFGIQIKMDTMLSDILSRLLFTPNTITEYTVVLDYIFLGCITVLLLRRSVVSLLEFSSAGICSVRELSSKPGFRIIFGTNSIISCSSDTVMMKFAIDNYVSSLYDHRLNITFVAFMTIKVKI